MLQLNDILEQWKSDSLIEMPLDESSQKTPKLHSKYLELLSLAKFQLKKAEMAQKYVCTQVFESVTVKQTVNVSSVR